MKPLPQPTIGDVADAAGVSRATVSRVLNGNLSVDPSLADRVRASARRLGYRPNLTALSLARGTTGMIGVIVPDLANPYFPGVLHGVETAAGAAGCRMLVADSNERADEEERLVEELLRRCDGVVLCSPRLGTARLRRLAGRRLPLVTVNRVEAGVDLSGTAIAHTQVAHDIVEALVARGHRRVGYLAGPTRSWSNARRLASLRDAADRLGVQLRVHPAGSMSEGGRRAMRLALRARATAVVAFNDLVALGAMAWAREVGCGIPDDVSLVGFDDIPSAELLGLSTVRLPKEELGLQAWELLHAVMRGEPGGTRWLEADLLLRESIGPVVRHSAGRTPA